MATTRQAPRYGVRVVREGVVDVWYMQDGDRVQRTWSVVGQDRGYVYDVTTHPGTLGQQVMDTRAERGTTLRCSRDSLPDVARQILRREADAVDRERASW